MYSFHVYILPRFHWMKVLESGKFVCVNMAYSKMRYNTVSTNSFTMHAYCKWSSTQTFR